MSEEMLDKFEKRLEMFQKGFEMITANLNTQLAKIAADIVQLNERAAFMPKQVKENKEMFKEVEKVNLMVGSLMSRLDDICIDKMY